MLISNNTTLIIDNLDNVEAHHSSGKSMAEEKKETQRKQLENN